MDINTPVNVNTLGFLKDNVLNIADLTRTKKLTEILNSYTDKTSYEIFIVQNSKNKKASAVISDLEFFEELLRYKEAVDDAIDQVIYEVALERKDDVADIELAKVVKDNNLDIKNIVSLIDEVEEE